MTPWIYLRLSLRALARNKLRSALAMLGVIIGVAAVISIVSLGEAANRMVQEQIASLGANRLMISPGSQKVGGFHGGQGTVLTLVEEDFDAILKECPSIAIATPGVWGRAQVVYGNRNWSTLVQGVNDRFPEIRDWTLEKGRFFSAADARGGTKVCVLGQTVVKNLFGLIDPIGKSVRVRHLPFTVVGVLTRKGEAPWGADFDDVVIAPFRTVQKKLLGIEYLNHIQASARDVDSMEEAQEEVTAVLRRRHHIRPEEDDDFQVRNQKEIANAARTAGQTLTLLLGAIAAVSLLVGGIGVMNIMLVSVSERTREIAIRMAVGAREADVLSQFLAESVCLTGIGGLAGIALACVAAEAMASVVPWPFRVAPWAAALSFAFSGVVGVVFGLYPAWRASKLDPADGLRQT